MIILSLLLLNLLLTSAANNFDQPQAPVDNQNNLQVQQVDNQVQPAQAQVQGVNEFNPLVIISKRDYVPDYTYESLVVQKEEPLKEFLAIDSSDYRESKRLDISLENLPSDLFLSILKCLDAETLAKLGQVNHRIRNQLDEVLNNMIKENGANSDLSNVSRKDKLVYAAHISKYFKASYPGLWGRRMFYHDLILLSLISTLASAPSTEDANGDIVESSASEYQEIKSAFMKMDIVESFNNVTLSKAVIPSMFKSPRLIENILFELIKTKPIPYTLEALANLQLQPNDFVKHSNFRVGDCPVEIMGLVMGAIDPRFIINYVETVDGEYLVNMRAKQRHFVHEMIVKSVPFSLEIFSRPELNLIPLSAECFGFSFYSAALVYAFASNNFSVLNGLLANFSNDKFPGILADNLDKMRENRDLLKKDVSNDYPGMTTILRDIKI